VNILLTGATGLVGTDLLSSLLGAGHVVTAVSRHSENSNANVTWRMADFTEDSRPFLANLPIPDAVIHCAAAKDAGGTPEELHRIREVNFRFTDELWAWAGRSRVPVVLFISTMNFLRRPLLENITEDHPVGPSNAYGMSKLWGELSLFRHAEHHGFRAISFRITSPVCFDLERMHDNVVRLWINDARVGSPLHVQAGGKRIQDFVATSDIALAVLRAVERQNAAGVFNIAAGDSLSMLDTARLIANRFGGRYIVDLGDNAPFERWCVSLEKARAILDYRPQYSSSGSITTLMTTLE
jgi:UDP-glucose 4-epimerase